MNIVIKGKDEDRRWKCFEKYLEKHYGPKFRSRYNLWKFFAAYKLEDTIIIPRWGEFAQVRLIGDVELFSDINVSQLGIVDNSTKQPIVISEDGKTIRSSTGQKYDLGFARKVEFPKEWIPRSYIADANLYGRMKTYSTITNMSDLKEEIDRAIDNYNNNQKPMFREQAYAMLVPHIRDFIQKKIHYNQLEILFKSYFEKIGATEVVIPSKNSSEKSGVSDIDITAYFELIKHTINVQIKKHDKNSISDEFAIKQLADSMTLGNNDAEELGASVAYWAITASDDFNEKAKELAREHNIRLINGDKLSEMLLDAGIADLYFDNKY